MFVTVSDEMEDAMSTWTSPEHDPTPPATPTEWSPQTPRPIEPPGVLPPTSAPAAFAPTGSEPASPAIRADEMTSPAPRRPRRWPWVASAAIVALVVGGAIGYEATSPTRDHLRDQRDAAQSQLGQANSDLADAKSAGASAKATSDACQRLVTDSQTLLSDWDKLMALWQDPANQYVVVGSAQDQALTIQTNDIMMSITFDRGVVTSAAESCNSAPRGV